ncbi:MAG: S-methyl-5-thioribose-1-phosphate isomerase [Sporichthyaceae bacterium]
MTWNAPALRWDPDGPAVVLLDQTRLPAEEALLRCTDVATLVEAIVRLAVRGAPLLGIAGGFGVALAAARGDDVAAAAAALASARPTAVNLARGVAVAFAAYERGGAAAARAAARAVQEAEDTASRRMAEHGLRLVPEDARILTHCNTGALACGGEGSAFAVVLAAHRAGRLAHLWVDETRPLLQGARLTAWEAQRNGLPYSVLPDSAAAALMAAGRVDLIVVGADRIAADGSVANKVGTYGLAVAARHHGVPFVVVAPVSTVDADTPDGAAIVVEQRDVEEVVSLGGIRSAPAGAGAWNPAFDVTPADLVTALVTDVGVLAPVNAETVATLTTPAAADCRS